MDSTTEILASASSLLAEHVALLSRVRQNQQSHRRDLENLIDVPWDLVDLPVLASPALTPPDSPPSYSEQNHAQIRREKMLARTDLPPAKLARLARYANYVPEEETIRNDYSQRYVDGGEWPQNWVLGAEIERRFEEYPKQQRLLALKTAAVASHSLSSSFLPFSDLSTLHPCKFDVILLDPPFSSTFTWTDLQELPIPSLAADPSFVFLWVGSGAGEALERGREVLGRWGYRRCEDVVWCATNKSESGTRPGTDPPTTSLFTRTKQHCLIGIRGTVRRSTDSWFVHCNVDTDVIIWPGDPTDPTRKPPEMYSLIENFCLGIRRLEVFGKATSSLRRGWVTVLGDSEISKAASFSADDDSVPSRIGDSTRWDRNTWETGVKALSNGGRAVVPMTPDIEALRPKSPFRPGQNQTQNQGQTGNTAPRFAAGKMSGQGGMGQGGMMMQQQQQMMNAAMNDGMWMMNPAMGAMGMNPASMIMAPIPMSFQNPQFGGQGFQNPSAFAGQFQGQNPAQFQGQMFGGWEGWPMTGNPMNPIATMNTNMGNSMNPNMANPMNLNPNMGMGWGTYQ
ncbi:MT-A70-domain-containing protein [Mycena floridula]|nr:MT-A70-domain-containing protein [Mycena floridula]